VNSHGVLEMHERLLKSSSRLANSRVDNVKIAQDLNRLQFQFINALDTGYLYGKHLCIWWSTG